MNSKLTLSELNTQIRDALQDAFPSTVWIIAEISELKVNRTGHCYLELVEKDEDSDEIAARARATIWSYTFRMLKPYFETTTGQFFHQGIKVLVQVAVEFHPSYGLSLNIKDIDPTYTLGDLVKRRRAIIQQLENAGVLNMNKELIFPTVPQRIAVISSATAAGYQDFVNQLEGNSFGFRFEHTLFEAFMQGNEAIQSILRALDRIFRQEQNFDAVAIIRGGGAQADLSFFDNYELAYTVAQFPLPVVTGIGHEKDDTILDLVAHTRQKTPTAAAEFFISGMAAFYERLVWLKNSLVENVRQTVNYQTEELGNITDDFSDSVGKYLTNKALNLNKLGLKLKNRVNDFSYYLSLRLNRYQHITSKTTSRFFQKNNNKMDSLSRSTHYSCKIGIEIHNFRLDQFTFSLPKELKNRLAKERKVLETKEEALRLLDPRNVLERGFTITSQGGKIVKSVSELTDEEIKSTFKDGAVISKIIKT